MVCAIARHKSEGLWNGFIEQDFISVLNIEAASFENVDYISHLAGIAHAGSTGFSWKDYYQVNYKATKQLVELAGQARVKKFVFVSSVKAGNIDNKEIVSKFSLAADPYGESKRLAENAVAEVSNKYNMDYVIIRPTLVYGAGLKGNLLKMVNAIDNDRFPPIPDVNNRRSLVHVSDLCRALILVAKKGEAAGQTYVVSDLEDYSTRDIYEFMKQSLNKPAGSFVIPKYCFKMLAKIGDIIERLSGRQMPLNSIVIEKLFGSAFYDGSEICQQLGFKPEWTLDRAMPEIVAAYRKSKSN